METHKTIESEHSRVPKVRINLPIPDPDVIGLTEDETVRMRYLEAIEKIAKMESETLITIQTMNNKYKMRIALLLAGLTAIGGAAFFGMKLEGKCGSTGVIIQPQKTAMEEDVGDDLQPTFNINN